MREELERERERQCALLADQAALAGSILYQEGMAQVLRERRQQQLQQRSDRPRLLPIGTPHASAAQCSAGEPSQSQDGGDGGDGGGGDGGPSDGAARDQQQQQDPASLSADSLGDSSWLQLPAPTPAIDQLQQQLVQLLLQPEEDGGDAASRGGGSSSGSGGDGGISRSSGGSGGGGGGGTDAAAAISSSKSSSAHTAPPPPLPPHSDAGVHHTIVEKFKDILGSWRLLLQG